MLKYYGINVLYINLVNAKEIHDIVLFCCNILVNIENHQDEFKNCFYIFYKFTIELPLYYIFIVYIYINRVLVI